MKTTMTTLSALAIAAAVLATTAGSSQAALDFTNAFTKRDASLASRSTEPVSQGVRVTHYGRCGGR